ncbi:MAG: cyclase family protein [Oscillospiraceae bacterium]
MRIIDITRTFQDAPLYPGSESPRIEPVSSLTEGADCGLSRITADSHTGTHADAPSHYLAEGLTIDQMPLENYCGKCRVITVPAGTLTKLDDIRGKIAGYDRIVLHGGGEAQLCEEAAEYLAACRVKALVTDALSVGPLDNERAIHETLLAAGVAIIENAVLDGVEDGEYLLFAFPVKYGGCDGAPVRAVLVQGDD